MLHIHHQKKKHQALHAFKSRSFFLISHSHFFRLFSSCLFQLY